MFSHIFIGVKNFQRAFEFYKSVMEALGTKLRFVEHERPWAGWQSEPGPRPLFLIGKPFDRDEHAVGNGQMVAFLAKDRQTVDRVYTVALERGATSEGKPGLRTEYHADYYGAYFRDTEGNKVAVACHEPEA